MAASTLWGCSSDGRASTQTQRQIGEARLQDDLFVSLTYGAVRGFTETEVVMRSASPGVEIVVEAGPTAVGPLDIELRNQHLEAELTVTRASYLDVQELAGCPVVTGFEIDCVGAAAAIGAACETSGQCPEGLRCAADSCQPTEAFGPCAPLDPRRLAGQETSMQFDLEILPCTRLRLQTSVPASDEPLRLAVVGPTHGVEILADLAPEFRAAQADFVVLLGDNVSSSTAGGLAELERAVTLLGTPTVVLAGPREVGPSGGEEFLKRFGPHDHLWELKGVRFFTFYSARGTLGARGLERLEGFLDELDERGDGPLIGVTHVPPFDPNDLRDNSFRNDVEAMQVLSLLEQHAVHQLYAGGLGVGYERLLGVETFVTTAEGTLTNPHREWVLIEIGPDGVGREVGDLVIETTRHEL